MADTVTTKWLMPPNWDGGFDNDRGPRKWVVRFTSISDGTGESAVRKVNISDLFLPDGGVPVKSIIDKIEYDAFGFTSIRLYWDRAPAENIVVLAGNNAHCFDFTKIGGIVAPGALGDATGDIMLTSNGATSGDSYTVTIHFRLK